MNSPTAHSRSARAEILRRIRSAQASSGLPEAVDVPRQYSRTSTHSPTQLRETLIDRLEDYKAEVHVCSEDGLSRSIADILHERGCREVRFAPAMDESLLSHFNGHALADDVDSDPRLLDAVDAVVTESHVSSAQTGTIVLESGPRNGRRALTLVPDRHVCIVRQGDIVYSVPEMVERISPHRPATWISGPSATSDIELSRVEGVHGPRDLIVIIVE